MNASQTALRISLQILLLTIVVFQSPQSTLDFFRDGRRTQIDSSVVYIALQTSANPCPYRYNVSLFQRDPKTLHLEALKYGYRILVNWGHVDILSNVHISLLVSIANIILTIFITILLSSRVCGVTMICIPGSSIEHQFYPPQFRLCRQCAVTNSIPVV